MINIFKMENDNIVMQGLKNQGDADQKILIPRKNLKNQEISLLWKCLTRLIMCSMRIKALEIISLKVWNLISLTIKK